MKRNGKLNLSLSSNHSKLRTDLEANWCSSTTSQRIYRRYRKTFFYQTVALFAWATSAEQMIYHFRCGKLFDRKQILRVLCFKLDWSDGWLNARNAPDRYQSALGRGVQKVQLGALDWVLPTPSFIITFQFRMAANGNVFALSQIGCDQWAPMFRRSRVTRKLSHSLMVKAV